MDNFKMATQQKLRFASAKGQLSTEQLWDLSLTELDALAVSLESEYDNSAKASFLVKKTAKDKVAKLRFDVVLEVLNTKVAENEASKEALEIKEHNKTILEIIAKKEGQALENKSVKDLKAMLR